MTWIDQNAFPFRTYCMNFSLFLFSPSSLIPKLWMILFIWLNSFLVVIQNSYKSQQKWRNVQMKVKKIWLNIISMFLTHFLFYGFVIVNLFTSCYQNYSNQPQRERWRLNMLNRHRQPVWLVPSNPYVCGWLILIDRSCSISLSGEGFLVLWDAESMIPRDNSPQNRTVRSEHHHGKIV